jgi:hypothetical protein
MQSSVGTQVMQIHCSSVADSGVPFLSASPEGSTNPDWVSISDHAWCFAAQPFWVALTIAVSRE